MCFGLVDFNIAYQHCNIYVLDVFQMYSFFSMPFISPVTHHEIKIIIIIIQVDVMDQSIERYVNCVKKTFDQTKEMDRSRLLTTDFFFFCLVVRHNTFLDRFTMINSPIKLECIETVW